MKSCNVVMMRIVSLEGKEKFVQYQKIFGFGEKTGIDLPGEASGLIYQASNMDPASLATNAFGQNYNCTMVQMAAGYASLINGGSYYEPHVVKEILNDEGSVVKSVSPNLVRETVSESTSNFINNALYQTVSGDGGTAGAAAVAGYEVAGKTGTAQENEKRPNHALFVGYAPADSPQIAIATRIAYGYGSSNACVFVDLVMKYYFKQNTEEELLNGKATNVGTSSNSFGD